MKIILLQNFKNLGKKGDSKEVAEGYARNFLFPKKIAELATEENIKENELRKNQEKSGEEAKKVEFAALAEKIKNKKIIIRAKEKGGKLFGSVSAREIAESLKKDNLEISENSIIISEAIKNTGVYKIEIALNPEIKTFVNLEVLGEK